MAKSDCGSAEGTGTLAAALAQAQRMLAGRPDLAEEQAREILKAMPGQPDGRLMLAPARLGESAQALNLYEGLLKDFPHQPKGWMSYGHTLKAVGRQADSIAAYHQSIAQMPSLGEAWWSLANLKTFRFTAKDEAQMRAQLAQDELDEEDRYHLHFALAKSLEDDGAYAESFEHYAHGNALRRKRIGYDPEETEQHVARSKALFTRTFLAERAGSGCQRSDPIFIVGLPRSGSTLIEQILASHSAVEGTMELPDIMTLALRGLPRSQSLRPVAGPSAGSRVE